MKSLGVIAHAKRNTGALYINGKNYYASLSDVIFSIGIIFLLLFICVAKMISIGDIKSVTNSLIVDQNSFFNDKLGSIGHLLTGYNTSNTCLVPKMEGHLTLEF